VLTGEQRLQSHYAFIGHLYIVFFYSLFSSINYFLLGCLSC
jgi:hypothetical protein